MRRREFIHSHRGLPFGGDVQTGALMQHSFTDVAALVLSEGRARWPKLRVRVWRQRMRPKWGDRFLVYGNDDMAPCVVELDVAHVAPAGPAAKDDDIDWDNAILPKTRKGKTVLQGGGAACAATSEEVDFVEELPDFYRIMRDVAGPDVEGLFSDPDPDNDSGGDSNSAEDLGGEEPAPPTPPLDLSGPSGSGDLPREEVTLANCSSVLFYSSSLRELEERFADFYIDHRWAILRRSDETRLGQIRCIQGSSLRCDCHTHRGKCKIHLDIRGRFEGCQCALSLWCLHGTTCSLEENLADAKRCSTKWREPHE